MSLIASDISHFAQTANKGDELVYFKLSDGVVRDDRLFRHVRAVAKAEGMQLHTRATLSGLEYLVVR